MSIEIKKVQEIQKDLLKTSKELYMDGFGEDSADYVDFFFSDYTNSGSEIIMYFEDGNLISQGFIIEKRMKIFGTDMTVPYLTALSTFMPHRGKGKLKNIMDAAFDRMRQKGYPLFLLYPFNYGYYKKFTLADISYAKQKTGGGNIYFTERCAEQSDAKLISDMFNKMSSSFENAILYDERTVTNIIKEYNADSCVFRIMQNNEGEPFAAYVEMDGEIPIYAATDFTLFESSKNINGLKYYDFTIHDTPYIQGRIICVKSMIELYNNSIAQKDKNNIRKVRIIDAQIKENNITAEIYKADMLENEMTVQTLTAFLFKDKRCFFADKY